MSNTDILSRVHYIVLKGNLYMGRYLHFVRKRIEISHSLCMYSPPLMWLTNGS